MSVLKCREPVPKKGAHLDTIPVPITARSHVCNGSLNGRNVLVTEPEEIYFLHNKGNFGSCMLQKRQSRIVRSTEQHRYKRRKIWPQESGTDSSRSTDTPIINVIDDQCDGTEDTEVEDEKLAVVDDPYPLIQLLQLDFLDSFYLMHYLECLTVCRDNQPLETASFWRMCYERDANFIPSYVSYLHFREKGWVVKNGLKFGVHLLLYKYGPAYYHGSYSVLIQAVTSDMSTPDPYFATEELNWPNILAWNRTTEHVSKELLICYVIRSKNLTKDDLSSPNCLSSFKVQEVLVKRWKSSEEREQDDDQC